MNRPDLLNGSSFIPFLSKKIKSSFGDAISFFATSGLGWLSKKVFAFEQIGPVHR